MDPVTTSIILFILPGMLGGLVRGAIGVSKSMKKDSKMNISRLIFMLIVSILVGGFTSTIIGGDIATSMLAGFAGSDILENLYKYKFLLRI